MKSGIIMKILALLMAVVTIYVLVIWEPDISNENSKGLNQLTKNSSIQSKSDEILGSHDVCSEEVIKDDIEVDYNDQGSKKSVLEEENISMEASINIDLNYILEKVSLDEKIKISSILNKLSVTDYSRFITLLSNKENNEGVIKAFELIKKRISIEDYKNLQQLLNNYVDFSVIDVEV